MFHILLIGFVIWLVAIVYLHFRNPQDDTSTEEIEETYTSSPLERIARIYVFVYIVVAVIFILYYLIWFFSSIRIVQVSE